MTQHPKGYRRERETRTCLPLQAETTVYIIVRCKLDEKVSTEAEFSPEDSPSIRVEGTLENEYTVSVKAPGEWPRGDPECATQLPSETLLSFGSPASLSTAELVF